MAARTWRGHHRASTRDRLPVTGRDAGRHAGRGRHAAGRAPRPVRAHRRRGVAQGRGREPDRLVQGPRHDDGDHQGRRGRRQGRRVRLDRQHLGLGRGLRRARRACSARCSCPTGKIALGQARQASAHGAQLAPGRRQLRRLPRRGPRARPSATPSRWSTRSTRTASRARRPRRSRSSTPSATPRTSTPAGRQRRQHHRVLEGLPRVRAPTAPRDAHAARCGASRPPGAAPLVLGHPVAEPETIATAIRIGNPASWDAGRSPRATSPAGSSRPSPTSRSSPRTGCSRAEEGVFVEPASAAGVAGLLAARRAGAGRPRGAHRRAPSPATGSRTRSGRCARPTAARSARSRVRADVVVDRRRARA